MMETLARYATDRSCDSIITILQQHCIGDRNVIHNRYRFNTRAQLPTETFDNFYTDLRFLSSRYGYNYQPAKEGDASPADEMLGDRIVLRVREDNNRKKLITMGYSLSLADAVIICRTAEITTSTTKAITSPGNEVAAVSGHSHRHGKKANQKTHYAKPAQSKPPQQCGRCGRSVHPGKECPARDATCRQCRKKGHYAKVCRLKSIQQLTESNADDDGR